MLHFLKYLFGPQTTARRYNQLFDEVRAIKPKNIMEIGVWSGDRACKMIEIASELNPKGSINYYGFDLFEPMDKDKYQKEISKQPPTIDFVQSKLNLTGANINLFKGDTLDTLPSTEGKLPSMDLIFIDGGHSLETIENDWLYSSKLMNSGSVVVFDDYWTNRVDAGSKVTVDSIDRREYIVSILPIVDCFSNENFGPLQIQFAKVVKI